MKRKLLQLFAVCMAMVTAIPIANAAASDYKINAPTKNWTTEFTKPNPNSRQPTVSADGQLFVLSDADRFDGTLAATYRINSSGSQLVNLGMTSTGSANAFDDSGNYIFHGAGSAGPTQGPTTNPPKKYIVRTFDKTNMTNNGVFPNYKGIDMSTYNPGRIGLYCDATGNVYGGTGYIWFAQAGTDTKITAITISSGTATGKKDFDTGIKSGEGNENYINFYDTSDKTAMKCIMQVRGVGIYDVTLNYTAGTVTSVKEIPCTANEEFNSLGAHIFMLRGRKLLCRNTRRLGSTGTQRNCYSEFEILDITDSYTNPTKIATLDHMPGKYTDYNTYDGHNTGSFVVSHKVSDNEVTLYAYVAGAGCSSYKITASAITAPVTNLKAEIVSGTNNKIKVSWGAPSAGTATKYGISISTNGGSTWSDEETLTDTYKEYSNQAEGTYKFKVRAYFGGSSTWGNPIESNSVTVANAIGTPITNLAYKYVKNTSENIGRQDIVLTWEAPIGMENTTVTGYKVYRGSSLLATVGADVLTYTNTGINQNYTYTVVPLFEGLAENSSYGLSVTTTEVESILYAPEITDVRNHDGYSIVEIFWQMPSYNETKPVYYNIYRNGVLLETGLTQYNFIDDQLPKISENVEYTYTVEAVYGAAQNNETRTSQEVPVEIKARDWSLSGYQLQEVYNIPVSAAIGNLPNNFSDEEYYRQGHFYNGNWYIAQLSDQLSRKDQGFSGGAVNKSEIEGATGGVVAIKAIEEADIRIGFSNKVLSSDEFASAGLAIDDKGVIFMRHNNISKLEATIPTGSNWVSWLYDAFDRRITEGALYVPDANGNYSSEPSAIIDLSALWLDNRWIDDMYFTGAAGNGQVKGRSDYYYMYGDVMSSEGGYLLLSPSWTRTIFKVKIANGKYVNHETHELNQYQSKEGMVDVTVGTGNYGFRIDGRDAWIAQLRSSGYFGIHGEEENHEDGHEHEMHAIFVADSRINNTGGTSIVAFNSAEGVNDGETFLITPVSMYSRNYGDFIVTRGTKTNTTDPASEAKLMPPMPVAQIKQTNISENLATNASGNWFHAEVGTYTGTSGEDEECVYIYQYVPGMRFAKYRLVSDLNLPVVSPTLDISTAYNEGETEITHFNGKSTWQRPANFALTDPTNASVWIKSYTFELLNANGEVIYSDEVSEEKDADGNIVMDYAFDYVVDKEIDNVDNCDLDFQTYTARIAVNYEFKSGEIQQSAYNYAIASNDYDAKAAESPEAFAYKQANASTYVWEKDPNSTSDDDPWIIVEKKVDRYRVELTFNPADCDEPVSYYTIKALVNNRSQTIDITDFHLHQGTEVVNGIEQAKYVVASQIPGTYNFDENKAYFYLKEGTEPGTNGQSHRKSVLTWHQEVPAGYYTSGVATTSDGEEIVITDEPSNWTFIIEAHYAANNRYIAKVRTTETVHEGDIIVTGVDGISNDGTPLQVYPVPAHTTITVKAPEAINSIVIYNEAGAEVMNLVGNGDTINKVNIESLATGYYFVKVNNNAPITILKK